MTKLTTNPATISADGEYILSANFGCGNNPVRVLVSGDRASGSVQIGAASKSGAFVPLLAAVTDADEPTAWEVKTPYSGEIAVKVLGASGPSLVVEFCQDRKP